MTYTYVPDRSGPGVRSQLEGRVPKPRLTNKQRVLVEELEYLISRLGLDPTEIVSETNSKARTTYLEIAKDQIIRS